MRAGLAGRARKVGSRAKDRAQLSGATMGHDERNDSGNGFSLQHGTYERRDRELRKQCEPMLKRLAG